MTNLLSDSVKNDISKNPSASKAKLFKEAIIYLKAKAYVRKLKEKQEGQNLSKPISKV